MGCLNQGSEVKSYPGHNYKVNFVHMFLVYTMKRKGLDFSKYNKKLGMNILDTQDSVCWGHWFPNQFPY